MILIQQHSRGLTFHDNLYFIKGLIIYLINKLQISTQSNINPNINKLQISKQDLRYMNFNGSNLSVYNCKFQTTIKTAKVQIKFPCTYFLQWKTNNGKTIVSSQNRREAIKSQITFNQTLAITASVLFDKTQKKYVKKDSLLLLNLISKSRPDQIKLVGRVSIDLSEVLNEGLFAQFQQAKLQYCSIESSITLSVKIVEVKQTTLNVSELDRSSFNEYMSMNVGKRQSRQYVQIQRPQGSSTSRQFQQIKGGRLSQSNQIRSTDQKQKNRLSTSSLTKTNLVSLQKNMTSTMKQPLSNNIKQIGNKYKHQRQDSISYSQRQAPIRKIQDSPKLKSKKSEHQHEISNSNNTINQIENDPNFSFDKHPQSSNNSKKKYQQSQIIGANTQQFSSAKKYSISNSHNEDASTLVKKLQNKQAQIQMIKQNSMHLKQQFLQKIKQYELKQMDYQRKDAQIRKLQSENISKQKKIQQLTIQLKSFKDTHSQKALNQTQKTVQLNKKILRLTQTISQWEQKYSNATFQTEQMRTQWKKQREQLNLKIQKITQSFQSKQRQFKQALKTIESLKGTKEKLQKQNYDRCQQVSTLSSELNKKTNQLEEMTCRYQNILQTSKSKELTIEQLRYIKQKRQKQLSSQSQNRISNAKQEINFLNNELSSVKQINQNLQQKIASLSLQLNASQSKNQELTSQLIKVNDELSLAKKAEQQLKNQIQKTKSLQTDLINQTLANSNKIFQERQVQFALYKQQKQKQVLQLQSTKQSLQNTVLNLSEQVQAYQQSIKSLQSDVTFLQQNIDEKSQAIKSKDQTILELGRQLQEITQNLNNKQTEIMVLVSENQEHLSTVKSLKNATEILQAKNIQLEDLMIKATQQKESQLQKQKQKYQEELLTADIKISQIQNKNQDLRKELEELHQRQSQDVIKSTQTIRRLSDLINQKEGIIQVLERRIIEQAGKNKNMEDKIQKIVKKQEQLKSSLDILEQASKEFYLNLQKKQKYTRVLEQNLQKTQLNLANTSKTLSEKQTKISQLLQEIQKLKKDIQQRQSVILIIEERSATQIQGQKQKHSNQLKELQSKIEYQKQSIQGLEYLINQKTKANQDQKIINQQVQQNVSNLQNRLNQYHFSLQDTKKQKEQLQRKLLDNQQAILNLESLKNEIIFKKEQEIKMNQKEIENKLINIEELTKQLIAQKQSFQLKFAEQIQNIEAVKQQHQNEIHKLQQKYKQLEETMQKVNTQSEEKSHYIQILQSEKATIANSLQELRQNYDQLKNDKQMYALMNFKEELIKKQQQIKNLQQQIKQLKAQTLKIKQLQRSLKIKTIELSSLKYKNNSSQQIVGNYAQIQEIVKLKNQEIQSLKEQNLRIKELETQLNQIQKLNEELYENIEQLQEQKFNFASEQNEFNSDIVVLNQQILELNTLLKQYAQRNDGYLQKINQYESVIQELYKEKEGSTTTKNSDKLTNSRHSQIVHQISQKNIQIQNSKKDQEIQNLTIQNRKLAQQLMQMKQREEESQSNLLEIQFKLKQKEEELLKKSRKSQEFILNSLPNGTLDIKTSLQQLEKVLSTRTQFYDIQKNLLDLLNFKCQSKDKNVQKILGQSIFQQKSRQLSKQFQLLKSKIMKSQGRNYQQKAKLINLIKPCQQNIKQLMKISEQWTN